MISSHTKLSRPAAELALRGSLKHVGGDNYHLQTPVNPSTGVGPIGSCWTAESGEQIPAGLLRKPRNWRVTFHDNEGSDKVVELQADRYDDAISKASSGLTNLYLKSAVEV